jgi:hypothetical protein
MISKKIWYMVFTRWLPCYLLFILVRVAFYLLVKGNHNHNQICSKVWNGNTATICIVWKQCDVANGPCHVSGIFLPLRVKSLPLATIYEVKIPLRKWKKSLLQRNPAQMTSANVAFYSFCCNTSCFQENIYDSQLRSLQFLNFPRTLVDIWDH